MRVVILGKGEMLTNLIRGCLISDVDIVGVFRYENLYSSKLQMFLHDNFSHSPELTLIKKYKLNDIKLKSANSEEFRNELIRLNVDILLVGTWAEKLKPEVFNIPKIAPINVHPSLLPKYRGPNPYLQTIWRGEHFSGITFHLITNKLDAGPILAQERIEILKGDTGKELKTRTVFRARLLCAELMEKLSNGCVDTVDQDERLSSYYKDITPEDMTLNFYEENAEEIIRHVKAFYPFRPTYIEDNDKFWVVNPYNVKIKDDLPLNKAYTIVVRSKNSLTISAKDGVSVEFKGLKKYN